MRGVPPPHPSRRAHARSSLRNPTRTRAPQDEAAQTYRARGSSPNRSRSSPSHDVKQPRSARSRGAFLRPGFCLLLRAPGMRGGRSAERTSGACEAPVRRVSDTPGACEAPCVPCARDARLSALHRGDFGLRSRASLTGLASGSVTASSSRAGPSARRAGFRASRGERLPAACRGTPLLAPSSRRWL